MKKRYLLLLLPIIGFAACLKNEETAPCVSKEITITAPSNEVSALRGVLSGNGVAATEDPRGFFYTMNTAGTGDKPDNCSGVTIDYTAKLMNGTQVDSANNASYPVRAFITGWQEALPLIAVGGKMTLYLPPSLAYGTAGSGNVPPNSNLIFTINLKGIY